MALQASKKDKTLNFIYSFGASIVILGALCKINHYTPLGIEGSTILAFGLIVEAAIFLVFAFDTPAPDYSWERAYPELLDEGAIPAPRKSQTQEKAIIKEAELSLSSKLDDMLKQAKLDVSLFERLKSGIENFGSSVDNINKTVDAASATTKYGDQLALAANHMESLNALYQIQLEHGKKQVELNTRLVEDLSKSASQSEEFSNQMSALSANLGSLNKVYGGMLGAMKA
jgi:gliding motility-associated protein GldL